MMTDEERTELVELRRIRKIQNETIQRLQEQIRAMQILEQARDNEWISVDDRLPEKEQKVFVFYKALGEENRIHNDVMATNWRTNKGDFIPVAGYKVTHWRPLPEPPKED